MWFASQSCIGSLDCIWVLLVECLKFMASYSLHSAQELHEIVCTFLPSDLAEYALNKCVTQAETKRQDSKDGENSVDTPDQPDHYNFDLLEDQISDESNDDHILAWMVSI